MFLHHCSLAIVSKLLELIIHLAAMVATTMLMKIISGRSSSQKRVVPNESLKSMDSLKNFSSTPLGEKNLTLLHFSCFFDLKDHTHILFDLSLYFPNELYACDNSHKIFSSLASFE